MNVEENQVKFSFKVRSNEPILLEAKKKSKKRNGGLCLFATVFFTALLVLMATTSNNPSTVAYVMLGILIVFALICTIYFFATAKESEKDKSRYQEYIFTETSFIVIQYDEITAKTRKITNCLYAKSLSKQYISKFTESSDRFEIKILTGTYNGVPQYKKHVLPKSVIPAESLQEFIDFLRVKMEKNYIVKNDNK